MLMATAVEAAVAQGCLSYFVTAHVPGLVVIMTHVCEEGYPPPDATGGKGTECGLARGSSHGGLRGGGAPFLHRLACANEGNPEVSPGITASGQRVRASGTKPEHAYQQGSRTAQLWLVHGLRPGWVRLYTVAYN